MFIKSIKLLKGSGWEPYEVEVEVRDRKTLILFRRFIEYVLEAPFHEVVIENSTQQKT